MPDDAMRHIRRFQVGDLVRRQLNSQRADGIVQMRDLGRPNDRRCHAAVYRMPDGYASPILAEIASDQDVITILKGTGAPLWPVLLPVSVVSWI